MLTRCQKSYQQRHLYEDIKEVENIDGLLFKMWNLKS
jgi:hypothetical protein